MKNFYPQIIKANASLLLATFIITAGAFHTPRRKPHAMQLSSRASNNDSWQRRNNDNRNPPSYYYEPRGNEYLNADYFTEDYYRNGSMDRRPEGYYDDGANYRDPFLDSYNSNESFDPYNIDYLPPLNQGRDASYPPEGYLPSTPFPRDDLRYRNDSRGRSVNDNSYESYRNERFDYENGYSQKNGNRPQQQRRQQRRDGYYDETDDYGQRYDLNYNTNYQQQERRRYPDTSRQESSARGGNSGRYYDDQKYNRDRIQMSNNNNNKSRRQNPNAPYYPNNYEHQRPPRQDAMSFPFLPIINMPSIFRNMFSSMSSFPSLFDSMNDNISPTLGNVLEEAQDRIVNDASLSERMGTVISCRRPFSQNVSSNTINGKMFTLIQCAFEVETSRGVGVASVEARDGVITLLVVDVDGEIIDVGRDGRRYGDSGRGRRRDVVDAEIID